MTVPPSVARLAQRCFDQPIIRNDLRGELVEEIVAMAIEPKWVLCAGDWAAFDLKPPLTTASNKEIISPPNRH